MCYHKHGQTFGTQIRYSLVATTSAFVRNLPALKIERMLSLKPMWRHLIVADDSENSGAIIFMNVNHNVQDKSYPQPKNNMSLPCSRMPSDTFILIVVTFRRICCLQNTKAYISYIVFNSCAIQKASVLVYNKCQHRVCRRYQIVSVNISWGTSFMLYIFETREKYWQYFLAI